MFPSVHDYLVTKLIGVSTTSQFCFCCCTAHNFVQRCAIRVSTMFVGNYLKHQLPSLLKKNALAHLQVYPSLPVV